MKPSNLLAEDGRCVVALDYGLVTEVKAAVPKLTYGAAGFGTPTHISPEQVLDEPLGWRATGTDLGVGAVRRADRRAPILGSAMGSVAMKTFSVGGKRLETRLFMRHDDGGWGGYTYEWNDAGSDATLLPAAKLRTVDASTTWSYPSRTQCMQCHSKAAGGTLGLETAQLNREAVYPARTRRPATSTTRRAPSAPRPS